MTNYEDWENLGFHYEVQGRYEYWAIDLYYGKSCQRHVESFKTKKLANSVCNALNEALRLGKKET